MLLPPKPNHHAFGLGQLLIDLQRHTVIRLPILVQHLVQQEIGRLAAPQPAHPVNLGKLAEQPVPLLDQLPPVLPHLLQAFPAEGVLGDNRGEVVDVVRSLEAVEHPRDGLRGEGRAQADARKAERLGQGLHDDQVGPLEDPLGQAGALGSEVDVGFVQHHHAVPRRVLEDFLDVPLGEQRAGGVPGATEVNQLDCCVVVFSGGGQGRQDPRDVEAEPRRGEEGHLDEGHVVHLRRDRVHPVRRGADQDRVPPRDAKGAEQGIDRLVRAHADEEVGRGQDERGVGMGVAEGAEEGFELGLVGVWVPVEREQVDFRSGGKGGFGGRRGDGGPVGVLVCVEEDVGAVIFVVTSLEISGRVGLRWEKEGGGK